MGAPAYKRGAEKPLRKSLTSMSIAPRHITLSRETTCEMCFVDPSVVTRVDSVLGICADVLRDVTVLGARRTTVAGL